MRGLDWSAMRAGLLFHSVSSPGEQHLTSRVLAVLFAVLLPFAIVSSWAVVTVSNSERWVATLHPLASNHVVDEYLASQGAAVIVRDLKVEHRIVAVLPTAAGILAPTLTTALQQTLTAALATGLESPTFQRIWDEENRITHQAAVAILDGRATSQLSREGSVVLDVTPIIRTVLNKLDANSVTLFQPWVSQLTRPRTLTLTILDIREIRQIQRYYHLATSLWWLFPVLSSLSGLGAVVTSRSRRNGLRRLALAAMVSGLLAYALLSIGIATASTMAPTPPAITSAILNTFTSQLAAKFLWASLAGAFLAGILWFSGSAASARATRRNFRLAQRWIWRARGQNTSEFVTADWHQWLEAHRRQLARDVRIANIVVAAGSSLLLWRSVTTLTQLVLLLVIVASWFWMTSRLRRILMSVGLDNTSSTSQRHS